MFIRRKHAFGENLGNRVFHSCWCLCCFCCCCWCGGNLGSKAVAQLDQSCQTLLSQRDTKLSSVEKSHISYITIPQSFQHQPPTQGSFCHHYHEAPSKSALSTLSSLPPLPIAIALLLFVTVTTWPIIKKNCHHLTSKQGLLEPRQFKKPTTTATPGTHTH